MVEILSGFCHVRSTVHDLQGFDLFPPAAKLTPFCKGGLRDGECAEREAFWRGEVARQAASGNPRDQRRALVLAQGVPNSHPSTRRRIANIGPRDKF